MKKIYQRIYRELNIDQLIIDLLLIVIMLGIIMHIVCLYQYAKHVHGMTDITITFTESSTESTEAINEAQ